MKKLMVHGATFRSRSQYAKELIATNWGLEKGMTKSQIAREAKVTPQTVHRIWEFMVGIR